MKKQNIFIPELMGFRDCDNCIIYLLYCEKDELLGFYIGVCAEYQFKEKQIIKKLKKDFILKSNREENEKYRKLFLYGMDNLKVEKLDYVKVGSVYKLQDILFEWIEKKLPINIVSNWYKEYYKNKELS